MAALAGQPSARHAGASLGRTVHKHSQGQTAFLPCSAPRRISSASATAPSLPRSRPAAGPCRAQSAAAAPIRAAAVGEVYEVEIEKPYGMKLYRAEDGAIYIDLLSQSGTAYQSGKIQEGDRLLATSAVFGDEMWPAADYGRVTYTVGQRIGPLLLRLEKRDGSKLAPYKAEAYLEERAAGNYGDAIREKQLENYARKVELKEQREEAMDTGLELYRGGQYAEAMRRFQSVMGLEPEYKEQGVAFYNIACCCSKLNQVGPALDALEGAMQSGFDDYKKIRQDPDLSAVRDSDEFDEVLSKYDEPFINENAIKALGSMFSIFGGKK